MKYMLKKPEFMEEAGKAKYMPNPVIAMLIALLIFIIYTFASGIIGAVVWIVSRSGGLGYIYDPYQIMTQMMQSNVFILTLTASEGLLALFTIIHVRGIEKRPVRTMGFVKRRFVLKYLAGFGTGAVIIALSSWTMFLLPGVEYKGFTPIAIAYLLAFMLVGAGEESLFRGYVLTAMMRRTGVFWSVILSSAFFALFHVQYSPEGIFQVFILGIMLSLFFLRTGSLFGAMGLHAAWDFIAGLLSPIAFGDYGGVDYSVVTQPKVQDVLGGYVTFIVLLIFIALLLFAGKGRLVVRKTPERDMYERAYREAKAAYTGVQSMNGKPYFVFLRRAAEAAPGEDAKAAVLLKYACLKGLPLGSLEKTYCPSIFYAAAALAPIGGETRVAYEERVSENDIAARVIAAENWAVFILGPGSSLPLQPIPQGMAPQQPTPQQYPPFTPEQFSPTVQNFYQPQQRDPDALVECPMLSWSIRPKRCRDIAFAVDMDRLEEELDPDAAFTVNKDICRQCTNRGSNRTS